MQIEASALDTMSGGFHYEGWGLIDNVDASGAVTDLDGIAIPDGVFDAGRDLSIAAEFIITIESPGDVDITPAETHYLGGVLEGVDASLTVGGGTLAFGTVDAPEGLDFPAEIRGRNVVVTVELRSSRSRPRCPRMRRRCTRSR